ncbi:hypothetical protein BCR33DRAFT_431810 [Rhizoclosmatium globosum]|uniref:Uncharacterized protein n=1 Tax=Rhizoclosmatium globosum TaxID=329046 RepID=A0A1Y2BUL2_9FUNG|nr:hypothetical protein BCR33DRAFT_431810 [Rhizoclosmatium globosum]|eukprot:ORY38452.1 hypothetical protein BCR33DRAFT_431810 [Rhizoclosmatium globosum]
MTFSNYSSFYGVFKYVSHWYKVEAGSLDVKSGQYLRCVFHSTGPKSSAAKRPLSENPRNSRSSVNTCNFCLNVKKDPVTSAITVSVRKAQWKTVKATDTPVLDSSKHSHYLDALDTQGLSMAAREKVEEFVRLQVPAKQVLKLLRDDHLFSRIGAQYIGLKKVKNVMSSFKYQQIDTELKEWLDSKPDLANDIAATLSDLREKGYRAEHITVESRGRQVSCIVFATPEQLEVLKRRGWLSLMDATHCVNKYGWNLSTILVRDEETL